MNYFKQLTKNLKSSDFETKHYSEYAGDIGISPGTYTISKKVIDIPNNKLYLLYKGSETALKASGSVYSKNGRIDGNLRVDTYLMGDYSSWKEDYDLNNLIPYVYFVIGNIRFRTPLPKVDILKIREQLQDNMVRFELLMFRIWTENELKSLNNDFSNTLNKYRKCLVTKEEANHGNETI